MYRARRGTHPTLTRTRLQLGRLPARSRTPSSPHLFLSFLLKQTFAISEAFAIYPAGTTSLSPIPLSTPLAPSPSPSLSFPSPSLTPAPLLSHLPGTTQTSPSPKHTLPNRPSPSHSTPPKDAGLLPRSTETLSRQLWPTRRRSWARLERVLEEPWVRWGGRWWWVLWGLGVCSFKVKIESKDRGGESS